MTDTSDNCQLPYMLASQADKHVTYNQAIAQLDNLILPRIATRQLGAPPANPLVGVRYLVAQGASGAWSNQSSAIASYIQGVWEFSAPTKGLLVWVEDEQTHITYDGIQWTGLGRRIGALDLITGIGINTPLDPNAAFSAILSQADFRARQTGQGGTGNLTLVLDRQAATNSAVISFRTAGLVDFQVGMVANGSLTVRSALSASSWEQLAEFSPSKKQMILPTNGLAIGNIRVGNGAGNQSGNVMVSDTALGANVSGTSCTAVGISSLQANTTGSNNLALGRYALVGNTTGSQNTAAGTLSLAANLSGDYNCAVGYGALQSSISATGNTGIGYGAVSAATTATFNTGVGYAAMSNTTTGSLNTAIGLFTLNLNTTGEQNTAIGCYALSTSATFNNCSAIGYNAQTSASNQVQLGNSATTVYVYGTVQNRSDARDKADVRDTQLGLEFICALRPVDYRWDLREDYIKAEGPNTGALSLSSIRKKSRHPHDTFRHIKKDGSKIRTRFHSGLIAQEVLATSKALGVSFGGLQDHSLSGGDDVLTLGYDEFIAPLIKSVQELTARLARLEAGMSRDNRIS